MDKFKLPLSFYERLHERLEEKRRKYNESLQTGQKPYPEESIPTVEQLEELIDTAFWASLKREEGRSLKFNISFEPNPPAMILSVILGEPIPFDVPHLVKLSPAIGSTRIGVSSSPETGKLEIIELSEYVASPVNIRVLDPGQLIEAVS